MSATRADLRIDVDIEEDRAVFRASPEFGRPVTFVVERRKVRVGSGWYATRESRWVVGLEGSQGDGFASHTSFERACSGGMTRARKYVRAYSVPRGLAASTVVPS